MSTRTKTTGWLLGLAILPMFFCMVAHVNGVTPQPLPEATPRPALVFEQYAAERRDLSHKDRVWVYYAFVNRSSEQVRLDGITPDCDCVRIQFFKAGAELKTVFQLTPEDEINDYLGYQLEPGAAYYILAQIDSTNKQPGLHEYDIEVAYEDTMPRKVTLHFNAVLPEKKIVVEPELIQITQTKPEVNSASVWIADYRGHDLNVKSIRTNSDWFTAKLGKTKIDGIKRLEIVVSTTETIPNGREKGMVEVTTDDPDHPYVRIPVFIDGIQGKLKPYIAETEAIQVQIRPNDEADQKYASKLISLPGYSYAITGSSASVDWVSVEVQAPVLDEGHKQIVPVQLQLNTRKEPGTYREKLKLELNDPDWPTLEIPIKIEVLPGKQATSPNE